MSSFKIRVRVGEHEVELEGTREEVYATLDELPDIIGKVNDALQGVAKPKSARSKPAGELSFPKIDYTNQCSEAITSLLTTGWGHTPRTIGDLREAMEANVIFFPKSTMSGVLNWMIKKGSLRRWKDKKRGYLYLLNIKEE